MQDGVAVFTMREPLPWHRAQYPERRREYGGGVLNDEIMSIDGSIITGTGQ